MKLYDFALTQLFFLCCWGTIVFLSALFHSKICLSAEYESSIPTHQGEQSIHKVDIDFIPKPCGYFSNEGVLMLGNQLMHDFIHAKKLNREAIENEVKRALSEITTGGELKKIKMEISENEIDTLIVREEDSSSGGFLFVLNGDNHHEDKNIALILFLVDNWDDVYKSTDNKDQPAVVAEIDNFVYRWCVENEVFVKKYNDDRYIGLINNCQLNKCEKNNFTIIEKIRDVDKGNKIRPTLSMGISIGDLSAHDLGQNAEDSLEIALSRGGDQVVIKEGNTTRYYGARINILRRRSKVKARMAAEQFRTAIEKADSVFIVGHKAPDLDAFGAAIAAAVLSRKKKKLTRIIIDNEDPWIERLSKKVIPMESMNDLFINVEDIQTVSEGESLLIIVDTNRPSLVLAPELLDSMDNVIVIDHHRRVDEVISQASFMYIDPNASSTSELFVEFFQYEMVSIVLQEWEATIILAGIALDTKNFTIHTGSGTFEAAAYLRRQGADPLLIRDMMRDDLSTFILRAEIMHSIEIFNEKIAMGFCSEIITNAGELAAQTADEMLNIRGVEASFVSCKYSGGVLISARSLGRINVQNILERLGGGGHMMGAGAQIENASIEEVRSKLIRAIDDYINRRG